MKIEQALREDLGMGDVTTDAILKPDTSGYSVIIAKEDGVIGGLEIAKSVFMLVDSTLTFDAKESDGNEIKKGYEIAIVKGALSSILKAERTALNFLQRMSGIATLTKKFVKEVVGTNAKITDTRKTVPGLRIFDKMAVRIGGGVNHRFGLDDMVLIKDNHIAAAGGISIAFQRCKEYLLQKNLNIKIEIETKNVDDVKEVLKLRGVHRIMLDNFTLDMMHEAIRIINHSLEVEASGNISLSNVRQIAETGVDYISIGALTHSAKTLDMSLEVFVDKKG